jgi:hypothetical protein
MSHACIVMEQLAFLSRFLLFNWSSVRSEGFDLSDGERINCIVTVIGLAKVQK